jgi:hypothetical protein
MCLCRIWILPNGPITTNFTYIASYIQCICISGPFSDKVYKFRNSDPYIHKMINLFRRLGFLVLDKFRKPIFPICMRIFQDEKISQRAETEYPYSSSTTRPIRPEILPTFRLNSQLDRYVGFHCEMLSKLYDTCSELIVLKYVSYHSHDWNKYYQIFLLTRLINRLFWLGLSTYNYFEGYLVISLKFSIYHLIVRDVSPIVVLVSF